MAKSTLQGNKIDIHNSFYKHYLTLISVLPCISYQSEYILGGPPISLESYVPLPNPFYCIFISKFSKIFDNWGFMSGNFFPKIFQNFPKFSQFFQNRKKNNYFCTQNTPKSVYQSKFGQIYPKTPKLADFSLKTLNFFKFSAPSAGKIWSFMSQKFGVLCSKGSPLGPGQR